MKTESNYPAHKLEFLALKWAICEKFHEYLYGNTPFEVYTDNNPLTYVLTTAKLDTCGQRWVAKLANYNFTIQYRSGQSNVEADALSRISWPKVLDGTDTVDVENMDTRVVNAIIAGGRSKSSLIESISSSPEIIPSELIADSSEPPLDWFKLQGADPSLATIIHLMESDQLYKRKPHKKDSADVKSLLRIKKSLVLTKGTLFRKSYTDNTSSKKIIWQLVVPKTHRHKAILGCHDDIGHQGRVRTLSLLRERFFWPGMQVEATQHLAKCPRCLKRKSTPQVAPLQPILVSQPLELVHLNYLTLEPSKGNIENVLVITDHFTRYALAYASKTQTAQATARILWDNFICHYGFPEQFISDQGRNFESDLIKELCKIASVKKLHTTPYHPQSNGQCERFNSTLCNMLGTLSDEEKSDWKSHLGCMTHAYNCTKHVSTTYSPYYLMFGRHPRLPIDVEFGLHKPNCSENCSKSRYIQKLRRRLNYAHKKASKYSSEQAQKYKTSYDRSVKGPQLQVNDLVLVKIVAHKARHKIQDKWESEEYIVLEQTIPGTPVYRVRLVTGTKVRTLHRNLLLPLGVKYQPDIDSDESDSDDSVHVDTSLSKSSQPEKLDSQTTQAKSVQFQSELPKVGFEDEKSDISQAGPSGIERVNTDSHVPPIESVGQVPGNESRFDDSTGTGEHLIPEDIDLPSQYLVSHSDDSQLRKIQPLLN